MYVPFSVFCVLFVCKCVLCCCHRCQPNVYCATATGCQPNVYCATATGCQPNVYCAAATAVNPIAADIYIISVIIKLEKAEGRKRTLPKARIFNAVS
jgi:hypothetical protein